MRGIETLMREGESAEKKPRPCVTHEAELAASQARVRELEKQLARGSKEEAVKERDALLELLSTLTDPIKRARDGVDEIVSLLGVQLTAAQSVGVRRKAKAVRYYLAGVAAEVREALKARSA